jgi:RimJ/RimL family protein N-acetyltransferase
MQLTKIITLKTERLCLRQWASSDRKSFARLNADTTVMRYFPAVLSEHESDALADRIQSHIQQHGWGLWAVEIPGVTAFAGFVGLSNPRFQAHFTPCTEVGWRLASEFWGYGYATEAAIAALTFAVQTLQLSEIVSFTARDNLKSIKVMERIGMVRKPDDDFEHPALPEGHPLRQHVLYRSSRAA